VTPKKNPGVPGPVDGATHHRNQGRQGARDKKRVRNPWKKVQVLPGEQGLAWWPDSTRQTKILNSPNRGIEDCTRLSWSSSRRPGRVSQSGTSILQAGLLALGSSYSRCLPGALSNPSGHQPVSSPITAAGPRRFYTVFPIIPVGPVSMLPF